MQYEVKRIPNDEWDRWLGRWRWQWEVSLDVLSASDTGPVHHKICEFARVLEDKHRFPIAFFVGEFIESEKEYFNSFFLLLYSKKRLPKRTILEARWTLEWELKQRTIMQIGRFPRNDDRPLKHFLAELDKNRHCFSPYEIRKPSPLLN